MAIFVIEEEYQHRQHDPIQGTFINIKLNNLTFYHLILKTVLSTDIKNSRVEMINDCCDLNLNQA